MNMQIGALIRGCLRIIEGQSDDFVSHGSAKNDSLKRLNDSRLKHLLAGLGQMKPIKEQKSLLYHWTDQERIYKAPSPVAPGDSWNRLEAFIIAQRLEGQLTDNRQLEQAE